MFISIAAHQGDVIKTHWDSMSSQSPLEIAAISSNANDSKCRHGYGRKETLHTVGGV